MKKYFLFLAVLIFYGACSTAAINSENLTDAEAFAKIVGGKSVYIGSTIKGAFSADGTEFALWEPNPGEPIYGGPYTLDKGSVKNYGTLGFDAYYTRPPHIGIPFSSVTKSGGKYRNDNFTFK